MQKGIVKWFNNDKGFGFIRSQDRDYFVHYTQIKSEGYKTLKDGENVSFTAELGKRGLAAMDVIVDSDTP